MGAIPALEADTISFCSALALPGARVANAARALERAVGPSEARIAKACAIGLAFTPASCRQYACILVWLVSKSLQHKPFFLGGVNVPLCVSFVIQ